MICPCSPEQEIQILPAPTRENRDSPSLGRDRWQTLFTVGTHTPDSVASSLRTTFSDVAHERSTFHRHAAYNNLQVSASLSSLLHLLCCSLARFAS